jgi:hypothetical protein
MDERTARWLRDRLWQAGDDIDKVKDVLSDLISEVASISTEASTGDTCDECGDKRSCRRGYAPGRGACTHFSREY